MPSHTPPRTYVYNAYSQAALKKFLMKMQCEVDPRHFYGTRRRRTCWRYSLQQMRTRSHLTGGNIIKQEVKQIKIKPLLMSIMRILDSFFMSICQREMTMYSWKHFSDSISNIHQLPIKTLLQNKTSTSWMVKNKNMVTTCWKIMCVCVCNTHKHTYTHTPSHK